MGKVTGKRRSSTAAMARLSGQRGKKKFNLPFGGCQWLKSRFRRALNMSAFEKITTSASNEMALIATP